MEKWAVVCRQSKPYRTIVTGAAHSSPTVTPAAAAASVDVEVRLPPACRVAGRVRPRSLNQRRVDDDVFGSWERITP
jgi:hypothetical protein